MKCCCCCLLNFHTIRTHSDMIFLWVTTQFSQKKSQQWPKQPDCLSVVSGYQPTTQTNKQIWLIGTHWLTEQQHTKHHIWNQTMVCLQKFKWKRWFDYSSIFVWCRVVWGGVVGVGGGGWWWSWGGVEWCGGGVGVALQCKAFHHPTFRFITIHTSCRTESSKI